MKLCLGVKPPMKIEGFRHNTIFSKTGDLRGGLTLVPRWEMQPSFHHGLPLEHAPSLYARHKS